ncbi:MAG: NnrU family protein, partial [Chloroflexota bacterium]
MTGLIVSFAAFAIFHSVTAAQWFKDFVAGLMGDRAYQGFYRLIYSALSVLTLLPVVYFYWLLPDRPLYTMTAPWSLGLIALQV